MRGPCPTELVDLTPLADYKVLKELTLPPNAKAIEFFRAFPKYKRISINNHPEGGLPSAEFWRDWDAKKSKP